jgi:hypothetical protein
MDNWSDELQKDWEKELNRLKHFIKIKYSKNKTENEIFLLNKIKELTKQNERILEDIKMNYIHKDYINK